MIMAFYAGRVAVPVAIAPLPPVGRDILPASFATTVSILTVLVVQVKQPVHGHDIGFYDAPADTPTRFQWC